MAHHPNDDSLKKTGSQVPDARGLEDSAIVDMESLDDSLGQVSYGKTGISGLFESFYVFGAALLASMGGFSFGYDQGVISIINVMPQFHEAFPQTKTAFGKSFMTAMLELGAFIGCLFMPTLADKISRKWALTVVVVIFNIGAVMQTAAPSYAVLVAGRTIGGIGMGTLAMVRSSQHAVILPRCETNMTVTWRVHRFTSPRSRHRIYEERCLCWNQSPL